MPNETNIVPVFVGDLERCRQASNLLLERQCDLDPADRSFDRREGR
jgi:7-keto-8-aminopelargonate synthetase-like enzyme